MGNSPSTVKSPPAIRTCNDNRVEKQKNMGNPPSKVDSPPGIRTYRDEKPKDYTLKIQDFSWLKSALRTGKTYSRYESKIFNASGYKWKLALYPSGDLNGVNHISLYLVTAEDGILSANSELNVMLTFLIYDSIRDRYLTIQDTKIRRFHAIKTEWGFEKLVSLLMFNDVSNGFLMNDCCVFGVDIVVMNPNEEKGEILALVKQPKYHSAFTWKVAHFSKLKNRCYKSDLLSLESYKWNIYLYPRGYSKEGFLSLYLHLQNIKELSKGVQFYVQYEIHVLNQLGLQAKKISGKSWFEVGLPTWGFQEFMSLKDFEKPENGFLYDNTMIVEAKINAISTLKNICF